MAESIPSTGGQGGLSPLYRALRALCILFAGAGGLAIFVASMIVTGSVVMHNLGFGSFRGEFEMVEIVCAVSGSLFLPLCQLKRGHVLVDLFTSWMGKPTLNVMDGFWTVLFGCCWAFLCWRLCLGLEEFHDYGDKTMLLRAPIWWAYVPAVLSTGLSAIVAFATGLPMMFAPSKVPGEF